MMYYLKRLLFYLSHPGQLLIRLFGHSRAMVLSHIMGRAADYVTSPRLLYHRLTKGRETVTAMAAAGKVRFRFSRRIPAWARDGQISLADHLDTATVTGQPTHKAAAALAAVHYKEALAIYGKDKYQIVPTIELLERAFHLSDAPQIAIKLAELQLLSNCAEDALETYLQAFRASPRNERIWYYALICALRHGDKETCLELLNAILKRDPEYPLARFFSRLYAEYPHHVQSLEDAIVNAAGPGAESRKRGHLIGMPIWGKKYVELFCRYTLASLLADGNLPALAQIRDVHVAIFTDGEGARTLEENPAYQQASRYCTFHLLQYSGESLEFSRNPSFEVACHAKFGLMSSAHYAALECARRLDFDATVICGDNIVNDAFLSHAASLLDGGAHAVASAGFRLPAGATLRALERNHRAPDGRLVVSSDAFSRLLHRLLPRQVFVESRDFARFPLFLCWRTDNGGILAHANHYHPHTVRGRHLRKIAAPSIDPVDGMFMGRYLDDVDKIHPVSDADICLFDVDANPLIVPPRPFHWNRFRTKEVGFWLWQYFDPLREKYFRNPICIEPADKAPGQGADTERKAFRVVSRILAYTSELESANSHRRSWMA